MSGKNKKSSGFKNKINDILLYLSYFGRYICLIFLNIAIYLGKSIAKAAGFLWNKTNDFRKMAGSGLKYAGIVIISPFVKIVHTITRAVQDIKDNHKEKGLFAAVKIAISHIGGATFGKSGVLVTIFNFAAPIICIVFFLNIVAYGAGLDYSVKLIVNGKFLGYVENEQIFYDADEILKQRINYLGSDESIHLDPEFSIELRGNNPNLSKYQVADKILEFSDISVEYAYGFYLNGIFMGAILDNTEVSATIDSILAKYKDMHPEAEVSFKDTLEYSTAGLYLSGSIIDTDWLIAQLTSVKSKAGYYIVEEGDTQQLICDKVALSMAQAELMNPGFENAVLHPGDKIKIRDEIPFLSVNVTVTEDYTVDTPYDTEYYYDDYLYVGVSRVTTEGVPGKNHVTARVTYVNNIETVRKIVNSYVASRPVTERIAQGSKPTPEMYSPEDAGYGKFIWPCVGPEEKGKVSEFTYEDGGYYGHEGIDITAYYGAPIYAGASGTVTWAGQDNSGFGKYIIIDHGNGYQTLYGHCSALYVTTGQKVTQGEFIAALGSTGWVTGPHLHFEVHYGTEKLNPIDYLEKIYR